MASLTSGSNRSFVSRRFMTESYTQFSVTFLCCVGTRNFAKSCAKSASWRAVASTVGKIVGGSGLGFHDVGQSRNKHSCSWSGGFSKRCKNGKDWNSVGSVNLEAEIFEFMRNSKKPEVFPSKNDLIDAGRLDLVEGIKEQGGWLAMGWDLDEDDDDDGEPEDTYWVHENEEFRVRDSELEKFSDNCGFQNQNNGVWSSVDSSSSSPSSSCTSLEAAVESDSGIYGILDRLERERNLNLGFPSREKANYIGSPSDGYRNTSLKSSTNSMAVSDLQKPNEPVLRHDRNPQENPEGLPYAHPVPSAVDNVRNAPNSETWRTWSMRRAGFSNENFEAAEVPLRDLASGENETDTRDELNSSEEEIKYTEIKSRLQQLQSELSSVLRSLRSQTDEVVLNADHENAPGDSEELSDALEFKENEIMSAQSKLRSTRAKLTVFEGKMALAIIEARKVVGEKQKKIDKAHRALRHLRTTYIVWPNSASVVFLAGSYDGWATQRKMEKSKSGVFMLSLKLYPGKYEIKFIVDGQWKIDPLRPIVNYDGYENNALIIT